MRKFLAFGALFVAACSGNTAANNSAMSGESDDSGVTALNDTTAIDAATGQAANMAADVNYTINEDAMNASSNESSSPADDSVIKGSTAPGETDDKKFSKEGKWGDLPAKQQAAAKNLINRNFPSHYGNAIEKYFKKLSGRPAAAEKSP